jgi:hypothetical protein
MKKNKVNIFEGRTKEWDTSEWQGRRRDQVEGTNRITHWVIIIGIATLFIYGFIKFIS